MDLVGTKQTVLVDGPDVGGHLTARLERDAPEIDGHVVLESEEGAPALADGLVSIEGSGAETPASIIGKFVEVEITGAYPYELTARPTGKVW